MLTPLCSTWKLKCWWQQWVNSLPALPSVRSVCKAEPASFGRRTAGIFMSRSVSFFSQTILYNSVEQMDDSISETKHWYEMIFLTRCCWRNMARMIHNNFLQEAMPEVIDRERRHRSKRTVDMVYDYYSRSTRSFSKLCFLCEFALAPLN